jgi:hypothetical protein
VSCQQCGVAVAAHRCIRIDVGDGRDDFRSDGRCVGAAGAQCADRPTRLEPAYEVLRWRYVTEHNPAVRAQFNAAMTQTSAVVNPALAEAADLSGVRSVVDIGVAEASCCARCWPITRVLSTPSCCTDRQSLTNSRPRDIQRPTKRIQRARSRSWCFNDPDTVAQVVICLSYP